MKEVAECCFQQLYGEIVRSMVRVSCILVSRNCARIQRYPLFEAAKLAGGSDDPTATGSSNTNLETGAIELAKNKKEELAIKLEAMGYDVGYRFAERSVKDRPRMLEPLDVIKFVCKDFWILIFKKQIDKLQTNHRVR
ncbi:Transport protein particle component, bet3, partial [Globisporangium splendens]